MPTIPIFQVGLYFTKLSIDNDVIYDKCKQIQNMYPSEKISNRGGYQSPKLAQEEFFNLKNCILEHCYSYTNEIGIVAQNLCIEDIWINCNGSNDWNTPHDHLGSGAMLSGVYYVSDIDAGDIVFLNPDNAFNAIFNEHGSNSFTGYNSEKWFVKPENKKLLLFPASLKHFVQPSNTEQERISISFNVYNKKL